MQRNNEKVIFLVPHAWGVDIPAMLDIPAGRRWRRCSITRVTRCSITCGIPCVVVLAGVCTRVTMGSNRLFSRCARATGATICPIRITAPNTASLWISLPPTKATLPAIGRLMKVCRARVVPLFPVYDGKTHRLTVLVRPPMDDLLDADDTTIARRMNEEVEVFVKPHTEQYTWILKLLKTRKPGEIEPYKRKELFPKRIKSLRQEAFYLYRAYSTVRIRVVLVLPMVLITSPWVTTTRSPETR